MENDLARLINQSVKKTGFCGTISIKSSNETLFENAYGYACRSNKIDNKTTTRYAIASGTKLFTALAVLKLIDQKKYRWNPSC